MASMRDIRRRKEGIENTQQITKAMKLVATVKLQKARKKAEGSRIYADLMYQTIGSILGHTGETESIYTKPSSEGKRAVIMITANRGLAGGYNQNMVRLLLSSPELVSSDTLVYALGRKGRDSLVKKGFLIAEDYSEVMNHPMYRDAADIAVELLDGYRQGKVGEIYLAYTAFISPVSQKPTLLRLLPVDLSEAEAGPEQEKDKSAPMNYEPDGESVLNAVIPQYLGSLIYGALLEAAVSEHGARMTAMDSATANAKDMMDALEILYNRARQGSITQELTEIIAGANAIS